MNNYSQVVDSVFVFGNKSSDGSQNPRNAKGFTEKVFGYSSEFLFE
jgi:hypothetical protein